MKEIVILPRGGDMMKKGVLVTFIGKEKSCFNKWKKCRKKVKKKKKTKNTEAPKEVKARAGIGLSWVLWGGMRT